MNTEEFWEWLATCPTHKYEVTNVKTLGYAVAIFEIEEDDDETIQEQ